jgi:DNA-directed RNA polymerase specialized sigma subunit
MKYDSMRKLKRNERLIRFAKGNPDMSLQEIGEMFGISRQRVWQIIQKNNQERKDNPFQNDLVAFQKFFRIGERK